MTRVTLLRACKITCLPVRAVVFAFGKYNCEDVSRSCCMCVGVSVVVGVMSASEVWGLL